MLHLMRPLVLSVSKSHHSFWAMLAVCVGGSQLDTVNTVCACVTPAKLVRATAAMEIRVFFIRLLHQIGYKT
jgi:hypothetical protein